MALDFSYASGSPFAWRVWLALEHKRIPCTFKLLSFDAEDLETETFRAISISRTRSPASRACSPPTCASGRPSAA